MATPLALRYILLHIFLSPQLYNRHALYLASQVGTGFDPVVGLVNQLWY